MITAAATISLGVGEKIKQAEMCGPGGEEEGGKGRREKIARRAGVTLDGANSDD